MPFDPHTSLCLHIGYPKTGTTSLQRNFFERCPEIAYLTRDAGHAAWRLALLEARELAFQKGLSEARAGVEQSLERELARGDHEKHIVVHSDESLLSHSMFFQTRKPPLVYCSDPAVQARKLYSLFATLHPSPKLLVSVRRQDTLLEALYAQVKRLVFARFPQTKSFSDFVAYALEHPQDFVLDALDFQSVIGHYARLFGSENVHVAVFEELEREPTRYLRKIFRFLGVRDETSALALAQERRHNANAEPVGRRTDTRDLVELLNQYRLRYLPRVRVNQPWLIPALPWLRKVRVPGRVDATIVLDPAKRALVRELFAPGNRELSAAYQLDLGRHGYFD